MLSEEKRLKLLRKVKSNIDKAYQHSTGSVSLWFTHAPITQKYVITLDSDKARGVGIVTQMVMDEPDDQVDIDDLVYILNEIYDEFHFRLLAHAFNKKTLYYLREHVHAHIREDIAI